MCLAIPAKVVSLEGMIAKVDMMGNERTIGTDLVPEVKLGDYVLVHAGFAIEVIEKEIAQETEALWMEVAAHADEDE